VTLVLLAGVALALGGATGWALWIRERARRSRSDEERRRATDELNRRLSELFSLQELSYILSESLQLDRIIDRIDMHETKHRTKDLILHYCIIYIYIIK